MRRNFSAVFYTTKIEIAIRAPISFLCEVMTPKCGVAENGFGPLKGYDYIGTDNISLFTYTCLHVHNITVTLRIERELDVKLVTLRRCKYYKWECVRKVKHRENRVYHLLTFR